MNASTRTAPRSTEPAAPIRILICEDHTDIREILCLGLEKLGFQTAAVPDGTALESTLAAFAPRVLLLDLSLPGEDGLSIAQRIRQTHPALGLVMLTARGQLTERVEGFACGADLYFVKPVDLVELATAIRNLVARLPPPPAEKPWTLRHARSCLVTPGSVEVALSLNELRLLESLFERPGEPVSRTDILRQLGVAPHPEAEHRIEALASRLRKKVALRAPGEPLPLTPRHGEGYAFLGRVAAE